MAIGWIIDLQEVGSSVEVIVCNGINNEHFRTVVMLNINV